MIDVEKLRAETPGTKNVIHLNNAGASLMPQPVIDAIHRYLSHEIGYGGYEAHRAFANELDAVYGTIADLISAESSEIAISDSATRAWDMAFYSMPLEEGDRILTTTTEYVSNWAAYLQLRDQKGVIVDVVPNAPSGEIDVDALESMIDGSVKLITLNHVPTNSGVVNPAAEVGEVARRHDIPFLLDACQSVGQLPVDVAAIGCDMLSATSRKFLRGPRGEGFLYVRSDFLHRLDPVFVELHTAPVVLPERYELRNDARRFETWEKNHANVLGLGTAVEYAMGIGLDAIWERIQKLSSMTRELLEEIDGVTVRDLGAVKGGIVTFEVEGRQVLEVRELLFERSINVSTATPLHAPVDMHERQIEGLVRASFHAFNTEEEVESLIEAIRVIA
ncbi:MAG: aminotransferase class V-fold PLP-dependent enzyme [Acidimicrobiia bacterium]|nr:MAG: aminotransferase class V-fold PLP-dependent enzyme [Acidimicrobiia bacterium]